MKTFAFCLLLTLSCFINSISAQSDSLIIELEKTLQAQIDALGEEHLDIAMYCDSLGNMYMKASKYPQADSLFTKALDIKVKKLEENHPDIADSYHDLGKLNYYARNYKKAIVSFNKALNIRLEVFGEKHPDVAQSYNNLGNTHSNKGNYEEAISFYNKALNIRLDIFGEKHVDVAALYNNLGLAYNKTRNYEEAINFYNKTLNIWLEVYGKKHFNIGQIYYDLGIIYSNIVDYEKAIDSYEKALNVWLEVLDEKDINIAKCYYNLGNCYHDVGSYKKAISSHNKSLDIWLKTLSEDHPYVAMSYNILGSVHSDEGNYQEAIAFLNKALDIRRKKHGEKHVDVAGSYNNIGLFYSEIGDYQKAINFQDKALAINIEVLGKKHSRTANAYNNLGKAYSEAGDYERGINLFNKALSISRELLGEEHPHLAYPYHNLGAIYYSTGNYKKAISFYNKAINVMVESSAEKHPDLALSYDGSGVVYNEIGNYEKAISFHNKALNILFETLGEKHLFTAKSYDNIGLTYCNAGDYEKAIDFHSRSLNILFEIFGEKHADIALSYGNLGDVYCFKGDYKKAIVFHEKALNVRLETLGKNHPYSVKSYNNLATTYEKNENYTTADSLWHIAIPQNISQLKSTYLFLSNEQRIKYSNTLTSTNTDFYSFTAIHGTESTKQLATNFLLNTKSLALDYGISTNQLIQEINDTTLSTQHQQLNKLNKQLADAETLTIEEREEKGWDLAEMRDEQEALAFQILQHPQLKSKLNTETIEWQDIQNSLAPDEATVDFLRVYEQEDSLWTYYAVVIQDTENPQFVRVTDENTLSKLLETDEEKRPRYLYDSKTRNALHKTLWQPLEPHLKGVTTVRISPSGILHSLPFESLQNEGDEYLATQYKFRYHSALRDMLKEKSQKSTYEDMLVMGHILYNLDNKVKYEEEEDAIAMIDEERSIRDGIRPLLATLKEVKKISKTSKKAGLKTTLLTIDAASEDTIQYFVGKRAPSIMHFATHGVFLPSLEKEQGLDLTGSRDRLRATDNPLQRSALMLYGANETWTKGRRILGSGEDGILTALEVTALDLQNTNLVVLSACSTGLGNVHNTEGVFGLQRAFKLAGVDYVVASLWAVDDTATKELMVIFYENLLRKKQDPATALRNAKETLRKDGYFPKHWAGFILIE